MLFSFNFMENSLFYVLPVNLSKADGTLIKKETKKKKEHYCFMNDVQESSHIVFNCFCEYCDPGYTYMWRATQKEVGYVASFGFWPPQVDRLVRPHQKFVQAFIHGSSRTYFFFWTSDEKRLAVRYLIAPGVTENRVLPTQLFALRSKFKIERVSMLPKDLPSSLWDSFD